MQLFQPKVRDQAIETICSNLIMAGLLFPCEVAKYMKSLCVLNNLQLAEELCESRLALDRHLAKVWFLN